MHHIDAKEGQRASALDFNQFETITKFLKETPETNRAIVEIGKAEDLLMDDPPCLRVYQFKIRYGCLYMLLYFRSWDIWGGFPSNLAAYQMLKESLLNELNEHYEKVNHPIIKNGLITDGEMLATSVGAHIYSGEWKYARMLVDRAYYNQVMTEGSVFVPKE
jgi:thymidylate synthase